MRINPLFSPYFHTYDVDSRLTVAANKARSAKVWDFPRLEDLKKHRSKRTLPAKKQSEPTIPALEELMKLLKPDTKPRSVEHRTQPQHLKRGLVQAFKRPPAKSAGRSALHISGKEAETQRTLRPRIVSKSFLRRSAALQPLRITNVAGASDPCFRVMNYSGLELKHSSEEVKSTATLKPSTTPTIPLLANEALEDTLPSQLQFNPMSARNEAEERQRPRAVCKSPPLYRRPVMPISRQAKLDGWEIYPVNVSPIGEHLHSTAS